MYTKSPRSYAVRRETNTNMPLKDKSGALITSEREQERRNADEIAPILLTTIFQTSLDTGKIPDDWREAAIVPNFKKGDRHQASNYRPVSLTSVSCKVLEHIVRSQTMDHHDTNNILTDKQHGFRSKRSNYH